MMPISKEVILEEISLSQRILEKWTQKLNTGIPEQELPAEEGALDVFTFELCGELAMLSDKLASLARILGSTSI